MISVHALRRGARVALFCSLAFGIALPSTRTLAQSRTGARPTPKPNPLSKKPRVDAGAALDLDVDAASAPMTTRAEAPSRHGGAEDAGGTGIQGAVVEQRTLDGGAKVFRFGEVEIEGRLKSPQLVYFLRRVRAEFAAGDLGHRTFLRELSDTRTDPSF
jgi:hypothetical protein